MDNQEKRPLISIIVPVYNGSRYIPELMTCLQGQLGEETELVFVDDGSRDDSLEKLRTLEASAAFPVQVLHQENRGVSAARNLGMARASGEYLTFVDVDDRVAGDYLANLSRCARRGVDVVVFDSVRVREGDSPRPEQEETPLQPVTSRAMLTEFLYDPTRFGVCNLLIRRELLREHGICFPEGYAYYEDYDFLLQLFPRTERIGRLERVMYYYMLREASAMARFRASRINCLELMKRREGWLDSAAPEFAPLFRKWGVARLYWSVLWQAALALTSYREFREFARITHGERYLKKLKGYPDRLLQISTGVFLICKPAYYLAVRLAGRLKSKVEPVTLEEILPELAEKIDFY